MELGFDGFDHTLDGTGIDEEFRIRDLQLTFAWGAGARIEVQKSFGDDGERERWDRFVAAIRVGVGF